MNLWFTIVLNWWNFVLGKALNVACTSFHVVEKLLILFISVVGRKYTNKDEWVEHFSWLPIQHGIGSLFQVVNFRERDQRDNYHGGVWPRNVEWHRDQNTKSKNSFVTMSLRKKVVRALPYKSVCHTFYGFQRCHFLVGALNKRVLKMRQMSNGIASRW